jgi:hypothetical protein
MASALSSGSPLDGWRWLPPKNLMIRRGTPRKKHQSSISNGPPARKFGPKRVSQASSLPSATAIRVQ